MKAWSEVIAEPKFLEMSPEQQNEAQGQYFEHVSAGQELTQEQLTTHRDNFFKKYPQAKSKPESHIKNPLLDAKTGVQNAAFRATFSRMETKEEQDGWLDKNIGVGNYGRSKAGSPYITGKAALEMGQDTGGKDLLIDGSDITVNDISDWAGDGPALIAGTGAGIAATGFGFVPGLLMVGAAAGTAKLIDEGVEYLQGYQKQSAGEVGTDALIEGALAMTGEGIGRGIAKVITKVSGPNTITTKAPSFFGRRNTVFESALPKVHLDLVKELVEEGGKPLIGSASAGRSGLLALRQEVSIKVGGSGVNPNLKINEMWVGRSREALLRDALDGEDLLPTAEAGDVVFKHVSDVAQDMANTSRLALIQLEESLVGSLQAEVGLVADGAVGDGPVGDAFIEAITGSHEQFKLVATQLSDGIDQIAGGVASIPTARVKETLETRLKQYMKTKNGTSTLALGTDVGSDLIRTIQNLEDYGTARQMFNLRSQISSLSQNGAFLQNVDNKVYNELMEALDSSFDDAVKFLDKSVDITPPPAQTLDDVWDSRPGGSQKIGITSTIPDEAAAGYRAAVDSFRAFYSEGITKFDNYVVAGLLRDPSLVGRINPESLSGSFMGEAGEAKLKLLWGSLPEGERDGLFGKIAVSHFDKILAKSMGADGRYNMNTLWNKFTNVPRSSLELVYGGKERVDQIGKLLQDSAVVGGSLEPSQVGLIHSSEGVLESLQALSIASAKEAEMVESNLFRSLLGGNPTRKEAAMDWLFSPGHPSRIDEARTLMGPKSAGWKQVRAAAMQKLFVASSKSGDSPLDVLFDGKAFLETLSLYGRETIEATFGKESADRLFTFGAKAQIATSEVGKGGGLVAAVIAIAPLTHKIPIVKFILSGKALSTDTAIKLVTEGLSDASPQANREAIIRLSTLIAREIGGDASEMGREGMDRIEAASGTDRLGKVPEEAPVETAPEAPVEPPEIDLGNIPTNPTGEVPSFMKRVLNPSQFPVLKNEDGSVSTHMMEDAEVDGKFVAYPTIVQKASGELGRIEGDALVLAMDTGNYVEFDTQEEASEFAMGGYKEFWGKEDGSQPLSDASQAPVSPPTASSPETKPKAKAITNIPSVTPKVAAGETIGNALKAKGVTEGSSIINASKKRLS
jgi:hypothetical protein